MTLIRCPICGRPLDKLMRCANCAPRTRAEARKRGAKFYFTGRTCNRGHLALRRTSTGHCIDCARYIEQNWAASHPDKRRAIRKRYRDTHVEKIREGRRRYYYAHRELETARSRLRQRRHTKWGQRLAKWRTQHAIYRSTGTPPSPNPTPNT